MVDRMKEEQDEAAPLKRVVVQPEEGQGRTLVSFFSGQSRGFFQIMQLDDSFMEKPTNVSESEPTFQRAQEVVKNKKVVNDLAERVSFQRKFGGS